MKNDSWNNIDPSKSKGPIGFGMKVIFIVFALACFGGVLSYTAGWFSDAGKVVKEQYSPSALLAKYEWFKDAAAQLDAKSANIVAAQARIKSMDDTYAGTPRNQWVRADVEQYNLWQSEVAGLKANYNNLAAQYNSAMSKFNYRFTNAGDLPQGADKVLPREYREYQ
jgi:hypothetical protein